MGLSKELYTQLQDEFVQDCEMAEQGEMYSLDCAAKFKYEMDMCEQLFDDRKKWLNENADEISGEAEKYGKDGYKGFLFSKQTRETLSYTNIPEWNAANEAKKAIEEKSKAALMQVKKGMMNVDANGEEIPLPEVKVSSFIKIEKLKSK
ncbi:MAG: hypothetical protein LBE36_13365 [Flavobacteriaceae bacterium]|jgi:hypothetical protein|nr:hypothetical protein [Flavobacteriaceae bacterium]